MQMLEFEKPVLEIERELEKLRIKSASQNIDLSDEIAMMEAKLAETREQIYDNLTPWQRVQIARHTNRPFMLDYVALAFTDFQELHGDRHIGDDSAMLGGFARIGGQRVVVIGHQKGRDTKENLKRNFGSAHPEGYRKAMRLMKLAEKFGLPVITLIDTPGAFPGIGAEERNIAEAIAFNLREMMLLKVPVIAVVLGEGGGMIVIERESMARARGAHVHGVITGMGASNNHLGMVESSSAVQEFAIRASFQATPYGPEAVDLVECHGTSTRQGDVEEVCALKTFFNGPKRTVLTSFKSQIGHTLFAALWL